MRTCCSYGKYIGTDMAEIKDVMKTDVISVTKETLIYEAIRLLVENHITGLPVVDDNMNIEGIVTEKDVLRLLSNSDNKLRKVEDVMTKKLISFNLDDSLMNIIKSLNENNFRRVPIVDNEKLVGIISRKDIIELLLSHSIIDLEKAVTT